MFSYTKKEIIILAQELNVQKQTLERVLRLIDVLEFINTDIVLKDKLVLKGGTAINLTFYDYLRFWNSISKPIKLYKILYWLKNKRIV